MIQILEKVETVKKNLSLKNPRQGVSRQYLKQYTLSNYDLYEQLFALLKDKNIFYCKPQILRHPLIFYFGHTAAFFINKFIDKGIIKDHIDERLQAILAVGVDQMDWDDLDKTKYQWPSVSEVQEYRKIVRQKLIEIIDNIDLKIAWDSDLWVLIMGVEHEKVHFETSATIIRQLPIEQIRPSSLLLDCPLAKLKRQETPKNLMKKVSPCKIQWGRPSIKTANYYGWDCQFGEQLIETPQFSASSMLVSNGEYLEFMEDKGYQTEQYWDAEGWAWIKSTKKEHPLFWVKQQNSYRFRTMNKIIPMPFDWPVQVNNLEATAFCKWKSKKMSKNIRLPTEHEFHAIRELLPGDIFDWPEGKVGNINMELWASPCPVNIFQSNGFFDIVGNVYQHTCTPFYPFKNFQIHPNYEDYSTPLFDCRHYMIKGGAFSTIGVYTSKYARNTFRRHFYQFAGFRYVQSPVQPKIPEVLLHDSDEEVLNFIKLHFLQENSYVQQCMRVIKETYTNPQQKFIHVGCSVGMIILEMSKHFAKSYGTDYSTRYFQIVSKLFEKGQVKYRENRLSTEKIKPKNQNVVLYQVNPENPDPNKLNEFKFVLIDGLSIKPNTLKNVLRKFLPLMLQNSYLLLINCPGVNDVSTEEVKEMAKEANLLDQRLVPIQQEGQEQVRLLLLKIIVP